MATSNINEWKAMFAAKAAIAEQASIDKIKRASEIFLERLKELTPIGMPSTWLYPPAQDYVPGALRQSYTVTTSEKGRVIRVYNSRPYFQRVEDGWSRLQAPEGMVKRASAEWVDIINSLGR